MNRVFQRGLFFASSALALTAAAPAFAQEEPGDIVVTARRVEERLQDVPVAIAVLNQEQLTSRNIVNGADLAVSTPSLSVSNVLGSTTTTFSLRGFGSDIGTEPSVGVYFADVVSPRGASNSQPAGNGAGPGAFFDLQNVQVLKGPQGTLFGRNSTGGAILLVPQKPTDRLEGYVEAAYGNHDMYRIQGVLNVPLSDIARVRIGVDRQKRDGYLKNLTDIGPDNYNDVDYVAARVSFVVDLTPDLENYMIGSYTYSNTNGDQMHLFQANLTDPGAGAIALLAAGQLRRYGNDIMTTGNVFPSPHVRSVTWQIINTTTWQASDDLTVKNIVSYAELKNNMMNNFFGNAYDLSDLNGTLGPIRFPAGSFVNFQGNVSLPGGDTAQESTFTEEFRLQGRSLGGALTWQAGVYAELADPLGVSGSLNQNLLTCAPGQFICSTPLPSRSFLPGTTILLAGGGVGTTSGYTHFRNYGAYAQGTYDVTEQLRLTAGLRYTYSKVEADSALIGYIYPYSPVTPVAPIGKSCTISTTSLPDCSRHLEQKSEKPTWTLGIDFKPTANILTYAKWSRGFRAGSVSPAVPGIFSTFEPETVDAYELGLKTSWHGAVPGSFNVAAFYNDLKDQQLQVTFEPTADAAARGVPSTVGILNAGKTRIYGVEVDATISPVDGLSLTANYAYLNSKIQEIVIPTFNDPNYSLISTSLVGDPLAFVPKHKLAVSGSYTLPLDESLGRVTLSATYTYTDAMVNNYVRRVNAAGVINMAGNGVLADTSILPSRQLVDLNLNWKSVGGSPVDFSAFVNNLTNEKYYQYILDLRGPGGSRQGQVATPRMYGARLRYNF